MPQQRVLIQAYLLGSQLQLQKQIMANSPHLLGQFGCIKKVICSRQGGYITETN